MMPARRTVGWLAVVFEFVFLAASIPFSDLTQAGNALWFVPLILAAGACFLVAMRHTRITPLVFWTVAVGLRIVALPMAPGDDFSRYLWEGKVQNHGWNPYTHAPDAAELIFLRDAEWSKINHRDTAAIYPPAAELVFAAITKVSPTLIAFKLVLIAADLAVVFMLLNVGQTFSLPGHADCKAASLCAWYAWNPAVVYAFAGAAHYDVLMIAALTAAIVFLNRTKWPDVIASSVCLGIAIALKVVPIFIIPAFVAALRRRSIILVVAIAIPALLSLPFGGPGIVLKPFSGFADVARFNDLLWWLPESLGIHNIYQRNWPYTLALIIAIATVAWWLRNDWRRGALWMIGIALVLSPVLHPWYATWILPLAVWRRTPAWTVLSLSTVSALLLWETTPLWNAWQPNWITRILVIAPPLIAWRFHSSPVTRHPSLS